MVCARSATGNEARQGVAIVIDAVARRRADEIDWEARRRSRRLIPRHAGRAIAGCRGLCLRANFYSRSPPLWHSVALRRIV